LRDKSKNPDHDSIHSDRSGHTMSMKDVIVIGGPNGAGKSTLANHIVPEPLRIRHFLNADEIARGLSPYSPDSGHPRWSTSDPEHGKSH
jgi:2-phosphoglycerate kinase